MIKVDLCSIFHPSVPRVIYISTLHTSMRLFSSFWFWPFTSCFLLRTVWSTNLPALSNMETVEKVVWILIYFCVCHSSMDRKHHIDTCNFVPHSSKTKSIFPRWWWTRLSTPPIIFSGTAEFGYTSANVLKYTCNNAGYA